MDPVIKSGDLIKVRIGQRRKRTIPLVVVVVGGGMVVVVQIQQAKKKGGKKGSGCPLSPPSWHTLSRKCPFTTPSTRASISALVVARVKIQTGDCDCNWLMSHVNLPSCPSLSRERLHLWAPAP